MQLLVRIAGSVGTVACGPTDTISDLKAAISDRDGLPEDGFRLVHAGRELHAVELLGSCLESGAAVQCLLRLNGGGKKKKKKKKKDKVRPEDLDPNSIEYLMYKQADLSNKFKEENARRNFLQLERDKIYTFWEITKKEMDDVNADLRSKEREQEELAERHQVEIKMYKQRFRYLLYEHQNSIAQQKTAGEVELKLQQDHHLNQESEQYKDLRGLLVEVKEMEQSQQEMVAKLRNEQEREIHDLRVEHDRRLKEILNSYDKRMKVLRDSMEKDRKDELTALDNQKKEMIKSLKKLHDKALADIKTYYNDITHNNLELIQNLKVEVSEMKKREVRNQKMMLEIAQENKRLSAPMEKAHKEEHYLNRELEHYAKDKVELKEVKGNILVNEDELKRMEWEKEVLEQRFEQVKKERDELYKRLQSAVYEVQQKAGFKTSVVSKKMDLLQQKMETNTVLLGEALSAAGIAPDKVPGASVRMRQIVDAKDTEIVELQNEVAFLSSGYNEMIATYMAKLDEYSFPRDDLGFQPVHVKEQLLQSGGAPDQQYDDQDPADMDTGDMMTL
eukprot:TRINITY_DN3590_c0_g1_i14.p1 TRINITY_DN3590_c0_g1~~TRINITY_DN3590_c0_g1_i14.p1  ORF type:complete len:560 (-),score=227.11 TRINITY_DN3590_c0_g1_i14:438-2117(-)